MVILVVLFCEKCTEKCQSVRKRDGRSRTGLLGVLTLIILGIVGIVLRLWIATAWSLRITVSLLAVAGSSSAGIATVSWLRGSIACILGVYRSQSGLPDLGSAPGGDVRTAARDVADSTSP